jgi:hypothetical protein
MIPFRKAYSLDSERQKSETKTLVREIMALPSFTALSPAARSAAFATLSHTAMLECFNAYFVEPLRQETNANTDKQKMTVPVMDVLSMLDRIGDFAAAREEIMGRLSPLMPSVIGQLFAAMSNEIKPTQGKDPGPSDL